MYPFHLPKDPDQAADVVARILEDGKTKRNPEQVRWWISSFYMKGLRDFENIDYNNGTVSIGYMNDAGILKFRYEEIVAKYQAQLGRLLALDLSPAVKKKGVSLDGLRKSSVAQVVLDSAFSEDKVRELKQKLGPLLLLYGTIGVSLWVEGEDSIGIDAIPPWQLLPIPTDVSGPTDVRGLMRVRYVPKDWIKELGITPGKRSKAYKDMDEVRIPAGQMPTEVDLMGQGLAALSMGGGGYYVRSSDSKDKGSGKPRKPDELNKDITQLIEVWTETSDGYLSEYCIYAGMTKIKELYRYDHAASRYHMPIRVIRDVTVSGFWARSFVDQLIPLNNEIEYALSSAFQAVSDFDLYGVQLWPSTLGTPQEALRGQDGLKRIIYENDYTCPDAKPENIMPARMTAPQIQMINVASTLMDRIANMPQEMLQGGAPGRVDSSAGLGLLYEISGVPLSPTAKNIAEGISGLYRAMLRILKDKWDDKKVVSVTNLDDSLAGIVLDTESGTMSLSQNAIPYPDEVIITIASEVPVSAEQQKMELKEALEKQRITLEEYSFMVRKKGLDLPVGLEIEWQNYRRAMLNNIILFGDGDTPGQVIASPRDLAQIHIQVLNAFMARPEFYSASQKVRDAFVEHLEAYQIDQGVYPDQLPYPEDVAEETLQPPQMGGFPPEATM